MRYTCLVGGVAEGPPDGGGGGEEGEGGGFLPSACSAGYCHFPATGSVSNYLNLSNNK